METSVLIVGEGSEELTERAREIADDMIEAVPDDTGTTLMIAALGLLLVSTFNGCVVREHRLAAFDAMCAHCRKQIERETVS